MIRTQVQLTEQQVRQLRAMARRGGVAFAEVVRRCVDAALHEEGTDLSSLYAEAASLIGAFEDRDGATDLARRHDRHLEEAYR
jgi:hypothetical protein